MLRNLATGGLRCDLFFSHAWDEGVYELCRNALASWPDGCEGAYLCCLSNPQNLDIGALLGSDPKFSPFYRVLSADPKPDALIMLANRNTPIHSRLWARTASRTRDLCTCPLRRSRLSSTVRAGGA